MSAADDDELPDAVNRQRRRDDRWRREGERSIRENLATVGVLGWLFVTPVLLGTLAGRWLDHHFGTQVFWTATCIFVGAVIGGWFGWRWVQHHGEDEP